MKSLYHNFDFRLVLVLSLLLGAASVHAASSTTNSYTDQLLKTRFFRQPLVWVGSAAPSEAESEQLWETLQSGRSQSDQLATGIQAFITGHPASPWVASLQANLGWYYRHNGYFTPALENWQAAWQATEGMTNRTGRAVADDALVQWLQLLASLGRTDTMQALFDETQQRRISVPFQGQYQSTKEAYRFMIKHPQLSYRCGTFALEAVAQVLYGTNYFKQIGEQPSPPTGFSLAALLALADSNHLNMAAVERPSGQELVVPSVVHWKQNHYAAIVARKGDSYKVIDPTFQMGQWLGADAINAECSGRFLVSANQIPANWQALTQPEAAQIFGKGYPSGWKPHPCPPPSPQCTNCPPPSGCKTCGGPGSRGPDGGGPSGPGGGGPGSSGGGGCGGCVSAGGGGGPNLQSNGGMPTWTVTEPWCDIWLVDEPFAYQPAKGPRISFTAYYDEEGTTYWQWNEQGLFGLGYNWNCSWLSFVVPGTLDQGSPADSVALYAPGGGKRIYTNFDATVPEFSSNTRLFLETNLDGTTNGFRILYPSGAEDIYEETWTNYIWGSGYVFYLMTRQQDLTGEATTFVYTNDSWGNVMLTKVIDGDGNTNFLAYTNIPMYGYSFPNNVISRITDPYGRTATFAYTNSDDGDTALTNVVDVAGLSSSFAYNDVSGPNNGQLYQLTTPYGVTTFFPTNFGNMHAVIVTEPNDSHQMFLYVGYPDPGPSAGYTGALPPVYTDPRYVPTNRPPDNSSGGNTLDNPDWNDPGTNDQMQANNSFYWAPQQFDDLSTNFAETGPNWNFSQLTTNDFLVARLRHWNITPAYIQGNNLSMEREPSPDGGATLGEMTWYDYPGKPDYDYEGTSDYPILTIKVLPDGTEWYELDQRDQWNNITNAITTYSSGGTVLTRTNRYVYAANGQDLLAAYGPDGVRTAAYGYDANHQALFLTNALGEVAAYTYNGSEQLTGVQSPSGLITTNIYGPNGYLASTYSYATVGASTVYYGTNSYTYTNSLVLTHTDERGLTVVNSWDPLQRLTNVAYPDGTSLSYLYTNLDLVKVIDRMGFTTAYKYDSLRRKIAETNANGAVTLYGYCDCGALSTITNALNQVTQFFYDNQGNLVEALYPDGFAVDYTYNLLHQLVIRTDSSGLSITNGFDNQGLPTVTSNSFGLVKSLAYDIDDRPTNSVNANGVTVTNTYDNLYRILSRGYPDGGVEYFGYTLGVAGPTSYTNQITNAVLYGYDLAGRKTNEVYVGVTTNSFAYGPANDLLTLTDGKNQTTTWTYDVYGNVSNKVDNLATLDFIYRYDADNRLTNRTSAAKGTTRYRYDPVGNLTNVIYPVNTNLVLTYDALNHLTNMVDAVGATAYTYDQAGQLLSEGGLWNDDTVSYTYNNRLRTGLRLLAPNAGPWTQSYGYDSARRLTGLTSPAGAFGYAYDPIRNLQISNLALPNGAYIKNTYDSVARLLSTKLVNSSATVLDSQGYSYNQGNQRVAETNLPGDYRNYTYDNMGQLVAAVGKEPGGVTNRLQEQFGYGYDAAGNLNWRTNNALVQAFNVNSLNELTTETNHGTLTVAGTTTSPATNVTVNGSVAVRYEDTTFALSGFTVTNGNNTFSAVAKDVYGRISTNTINCYLPSTNNFSYDSNGNLLSDGTRNFAYDDENQLIYVWVTNAWKSQFVYDGKMRRRIRREYTWSSGWVQTNEVHYIYDGTVVIQERDINNLPQVMYTRGNDLSGALQGAGGIGGLLARTDNTLSTFNSPLSTSYYHCDGNGNLTCLINASQAAVAKYSYDPFGNILSQSGSLADANLYRFSSKEYHANSGLTYYLYRFYDPSLQRWPNRDPVEDLGFIILAQRITLNGGVGPNAYTFVDNDGIGNIDPHGLTIWYCSVPTSSFPTLGIGRHGYLWDDRPGTPNDQRECGQESSCGSGPHSSHNGGPGNWGPAKPGTICMPVDGSDGKEDAIMADCNAHANTGIWFPGINDCHNKARRCLKREGLTPPPNHRF